MPKAGWGVIGAGGIADRRTIPEGIVPAKNAKLVAVMTSNLDRARAVGAKYNVAVYDSVAGILLHEGVDAVYIASPNHMHKTHAIAAASAGKHVFCEKPLATSVKDAEAITAACSKAGVKLGIGFMMRHNAYHQEIKNLVEKGVLGTIVFARAQLTCWYPPIKGAWRQDPKCGGGGAVMDLTVHCVDLLEMLLGPVAELSAFVERRVHMYESDDTNALMLKFQSGAIGFVDCAFNIPDEASENVLEIQGSKGCVKARLTIGQFSGGEVQICSLSKMGGYAATQKREGSAYRLLKVKTQNTYKAEIEAFSDAVLKNGNPPVNGEDGVHSLEIVEAAVRASKSGKVQRIPG